MADSHLISSPIPSIAQFAAIDKTLNRLPFGDKLKNMYDIYKKFVPEERYLKPLLDAIWDGRMCVILDSFDTTESNRANLVDEQSVRVGHKVETFNGSALAQAVIILKEGKNYPTAK